WESPGPRWRCGSMISPWRHTSASAAGSCRRCSTAPSTPHRSFFHMYSRRKGAIKIINEASGKIRPSRMTLLLGAPGSGKTTFLKALAGKLDSSLKVRKDHIQ
ncbi:hypothetical protein CFC21_054322, partial [Triticum aestivum]